MRGGGLRGRQGASQSQPQLGSPAGRRLTVGSFWSITRQAFTRRCQALLWRGSQADEERRAEVCSWQRAQSSSSGAWGKEERVQSSQGVAWSYRPPGLPQKLSAPAALTRPAQWHLAGDHERLGLCLPSQVSAQVLGCRGPGGVRLHPEPESFLWKEKPGQAGSLRTVALDWAGYNGRRGQERLVRPAAMDVPSSIYPEPGWSSTPQGLGSLRPALPFTEIRLDWPAASPSIGLVN